MLLNCPDIEITGITTVAEHAGKRDGYARDVLALVGRKNVPVAAVVDVHLGNLRFRAQSSSFRRAGVLARSGTSAARTTRQRA